MEEPGAEMRNPRLNIGTIEIPAIIVPIAVSALWIVYKRREKDLPPGLMPEPQTADSKTSDSRFPVDSENLKQPSSDRELTAFERIIFVIGGSGWVLGYIALFMAPMFTGSPSPSPTVVSGISIGSLLSTLYIYFTYDSGESRNQASAIAVVAGGLLFQQVVVGQPPPWPWTFSVPIVLFALTSWWPSSVPDSPQIMYGGISVLLLEIALLSLLPRQTWYGDDGMFIPAPKWLGLSAIGPLIGNIMWNDIAKWLGLSPAKKGQTNVHSTKGPDDISGTEGLLYRCLNIGSLFLIMAVASFSTSCIGFERLILGLPNSGPMFTINNGGILCATLRFIFMWRRPEGYGPQMLYNWADAIGLSVSSSLIIGVVLMAIEQVRG